MGDPETIRDFRRAQIVRAARALVAEGGLGALTYGNLEARVSFTRGVITHHFANKADIVKSVLLSAVEDIDASTIAAVAEVGDPRERIRRTLAANVEGFLTSQEATRVLFSYMGRVGSDPELVAFTARLYARWRRWTAMILTDGVRTGHFRIHDVDAMAAVVVGQVIGVVTQYTLDPEAIDPARAVETAADAVLASLSPVDPSPAG